MSDFTKITNTSISFTELTLEHGRTTADGSISLGDYYKGGTRVGTTTDNAGVPTSGTISISNFTGTSGYYPGQIYASGNNITSVDYFSVPPYVGAVGAAYTPYEQVWEATPGIAGALPASSIKSGYTVSTITNSLGGTSGLTLQTRTNDQIAGHWKYTLPFNINYLGRTIDTIYVSANSLVYFRNSGWTSYPALLSNDIFPVTTDLENNLYFGYNYVYPLSMGICSSATGTLGDTDNNGDGTPQYNTGQKLYVGVSGTTPNRTVRFRYEGDSAAYGVGADGVTPVLSYTYASLTYVAPATTGLTSSTTVDAGNNDDGYWTTTIPWSVYIGDTLSSTVYVSTNFFISPNVDTANYINPAGSGGPAILFANGDRKVTTIWRGVTGTAPNRTYKIYLDGYDNYNITTGPLKVMVIFYENNTSRVDIHMNTSGAVNLGGAYDIIALNNFGTAVGSYITNGAPATNAAYTLTRSVAASIPNFVWEMIVYEAPASNNLIDVHLGVNPKFTYNSNFNNLILYDEYQPYAEYVDEATYTHPWSRISSGLPTLYDSNKGRLTGLAGPQLSKFTAINTSKRITTSSALTRTTGGIINTPTLSGNIQVGTDTIVPNSGTIIGSGTSFSLSTSSQFASSNSLRAVVENGADVYVAVGDNGTWISGSNGTTWTQRTSNTTNNLNDVCYGATTSEYLAVGASATITSGTFSAPTVKTSAQPNSVAFNGCCYGVTDDKFLAVGNNKSFTSTASAVTGTTARAISAISGNGTTVTVTTTAAHTLVSGMTVTIAGAAPYNATTTAITVTSTTAFTYAATTTGTATLATPTATPTASWNTITFAAANVAPFAVGSQIYASTGTAYTVTACTTTTASYVSTTAVAVGTIYTQNTISIASDVTTWTQVAIPQPTGTAPYNLRGVAYSKPETLTITAAAGTGTVATLTFAARTVAPFLVGDTVVVSGFTTLTGYNGTYTVTACTTTTVSYANATTGTGTGVARGETADLFVAVGDGGKIQSSPDGVTWTARTSNTANALYGVVYNHFNKKWIAVGASGTIVTSPDGITWTVQTSGTANTLWRVAYSPTRAQLVAVGNSNTILYSTNAGSTWGTSAAVTTGAALYGVANNVTDNRFTIVGSVNQAYATISDYVASPFTLGESITVAGVTPAGYNGTYTVTGVSSTAIAWANNTTTSATVQGNIKPTTTPKWNKVVKSGGTTYALRDNGQVWYWGINPNVPSYYTVGGNIVGISKLSMYAQDYLTTTGVSGQVKSAVISNQPLLSTIYARPVSSLTFKDICNLDNAGLSVASTSFNADTKTILIGTDNKAYPIGNIWLEQTPNNANQHGFPTTLSTIYEYLRDSPVFTYNGATGMTLVTNPPDNGVQTYVLPFTTTIANTTSTNISFGYNGMILLGNGSNYPVTGDQFQYIEGTWTTPTNYIIPSGLSSFIQALTYTGTFGTTPNRYFRILSLRLNGGGYNPWMTLGETTVTGVDSGTDYINLSQDPLTLFQSSIGSSMIGCAVVFPVAFNEILANTVYYVVGVRTNGIKISLTYGGTAVNISGSPPPPNLSFAGYDSVVETTFYENGGTTAAGTVLVNVAKLSWDTNISYAYTTNIRYNDNVYSDATSYTWKRSGNISIVPDVYVANFTIPPSVPSILSSKLVKYAIAGQFKKTGNFTSRGSYYYAINTSGQIEWLGSIDYSNYYSSSTLDQRSVSAVESTVFNANTNWKHIGGKNGLFYAINTENEAYMWGHQTRLWSVYTPGSGGGGKFGGTPGYSTYYFDAYYMCGNSSDTTNYYDGTLIPVSGGYKFKQICIYNPLNIDTAKGVVFGLTTESTIVTWGISAPLYNSNQFDISVPAPMNFSGIITEFASNGNITVVTGTGVLSNENPELPIVGMPIRFIATGAAFPGFFNTTGLVLNRTYYIKTVTSIGGGYTITLSTTRFGATTITPTTQITSNDIIAIFEYGLIDCKNMTEVDDLSMVNSEQYLEPGSIGIIITAVDGYQYSFGRDYSWGILTDEIGYSRGDLVTSAAPSLVNQNVRYSKADNGTKYIIK